MNQIEIWFRILMKKVIASPNFISKQDLKGKIFQFIDYFNETLAKPFNWTYGTKPLAQWFLGFLYLRGTSEVEKYQKVSILSGFIAHIIYIRSELQGVGCNGIGAYYDDEAKAFLNTTNNILYLLAQHLSQKKPPKRPFEKDE